MKNINLIYVPIEKVKTTTIGVYIHRKLNEDDVSKNAVLPYVLRQGCKLCPDNEAIAKYLENLYGAALKAGVVNMGDDQIMRFEAQTISDKYAAEGEPLTEDLLKLMLSVMFEPVTEDNGFRKSVVEIEKKNAKDRIMSAVNDKRTYAMQRCIEEMCKGEAYALPSRGTIDGVDAIDAVNLYEYYKSAISSSVIDIYVCGDADEGKLRSLIEEKTAGMEFTPAEIAKTGLHKKSGDVKNITDRMEVTQGKLAIGFTTDITPQSEDLFALMAMNSVFGAGAHSKLFNNVREKLSLAYYASSNTVRAKGIIIVNAGIEFKNFQKAYDETLAQLKAIQNGEISELEYSSAINFLTNAYEAIKDSPEQLHYFMADQRVMGTNYDIDYFKDKLSAVTVEDIVRVSQKVELDTVYFLTGEGE